MLCTTINSHTHGDGGASAAAARISMITFLIVAVLLIFLLGSLVYWAPWNTDGGSEAGGEGGGGGAPTNYFEPIPDSHRVTYAA